MYVGLVNIGAGGVIFHFHQRNGSLQGYQRIFAQTFHDNHDRNRLG